MSRLAQDLCWLLHVQHLHTLIYDPQTDELVECINQMLKCMLWQVTETDSHNWDLLLPYVLFVVTPQASTGFTPFGLLFG